jgi:DNA-binding response OmpR family regulator
MNAVSMIYPRQYERCECSVTSPALPFGEVRRLPKQQAELLALLLTSAPDVFVDMDTIIEALWEPDEQPLSARSIVRVLIWRLRHRAGVLIEGRTENAGSRGYFVREHAGYRVPIEGRAA